MAVSIIAALDENFAIGKHGQMPWHLPVDLAHFKHLTLGKYVVMGHKTALAIGKALPDRHNMVLTRRHNAPFPGQVTVRSIAEARASAGGTGITVIGGGEIYREALPLAQRLYLTWVYAAIEGCDTFFPGVEFKQWTEISRVHHAADATHAHSFDMVEYIRA